ncbi:MAG: hypothetical protein KAT68_05805 [Bacteroidales bacterium]|nr:hypothetical protein [Bacteroidales bacterium]
MEQKSAQLDIKTDNSQIVNICNKYWDFDRDEFKYKTLVKDIAKENKISVPKVIYLVKINSSLKFFCENCQKEIKTYHVRSDVNFENLYFDSKCLCHECKNGFKLLKTVADRDEIINRLDSTVITQEWNKLNEKELELLIIITKCKTKKEVVRQVFQGMNLNNEYSNVIWQRLNLLHDMNLIWIERNENRRIINYHTSGKLREKLKEQYPKFYKNDNEIFSDFDSFQIMLQKIPLKTSDKQPEYSGFFNVKKEILLRPNKEYSYGAWLNDDGSIFLRIEPAQKENINDFDLDDLTYQINEQ